MPLHEHAQVPGPAGHAQGPRPFHPETGDEVQRLRAVSDRADHAPPPYLCRNRPMSRRAWSGHPSRVARFMESRFGTARPRAVFAQVCKEVRPLGPASFLHANRDALFVPAGGADGAAAPSPPGAAHGAQALTDRRDAAMVPRVLFELIQELMPRA